MVAAAVGLDRLNMEPAKFAAWVEHMICVLDVADRIGNEGMAQCTERVVGFAAKRRKLAEHLQAERSWVAVEEELGIPWHEQVRILSHNRPTHLWMWTPEKRQEFETDVRTGASVARLCRDYSPLSEHLCRSLVNLFRGRVRDSR